MLQDFKTLRIIPSTFLWLSLWNKDCYALLQNAIIALRLTDLFTQSANCSLSIFCESHAINPKNRKQQ